MPNRILRDGFVDSEAVNALSDWAHRVYSNLLVKADDAGRFDGRVEILRSQLFPLGTSRRTEDFTKAIHECISARLVIAYSFESRALLQITKWQRCGKAEMSRFPWIDGGFRIAYVERETRDGQKSFVSTSLQDPIATPSIPRADGITTDPNTETETETETISRPAVRDAFDRWWAAYPPGPRKRGKAKCRKKWNAERLSAIADRVVDALAADCESEQWLAENGRFVPMPLSWLNLTPWETDPKDRISESNGDVDEWRRPVSQDQIDLARQITEDLP